MPFNEHTILPDDIKRSGDSRWPRRDEIWHSVQVYHSSNQSIANGGTLTSLPWNSELFDTSNFHDNTTNNDRLVIPVDGIYTIYFCTRVDTVADGWDVLPRLNGSAYLFDFRLGIKPAGDYSFVGCVGRRFARGDYVTLEVRHGGAANCTLYGGSTLSWFGLYRVA